MIHVVDYGLGNVGAFLTLYDRMSIRAIAAQSASDLKDATHIILPGVGAFDHAMDLLKSSGMLDPLNELVLDRKIPVLGVCVGMQILGDRSEEGSGPGLGWVKGTIRSLLSRSNVPELPLPHMGWNDIEAQGDISLLKGLDAPRYYFLHSFYFDNDRPDDCAAKAYYGEPFTCAVNRENIWGVQFHPEKSHRFGTTLLKNFAEL